MDMLVKKTREDNGHKPTSTYGLIDSQSAKTTLAKERFNMPWKDKTVEEQRMEFVTRVLSKEKNKSELCREYGISRPTGDKWIKRYENAESLSDKSRRPFHTANRISQEVEKIIVEARSQVPAVNEPMPAYSSGSIGDFQVIGHDDDDLPF